MTEKTLDAIATPEASRVNLVDQELDEAEGEQSAHDRLDLTRAIVDDLKDWDSSFYHQAHAAGSISEIRPDGDQAKALYITPRAVTPNEARERFFETPKRRIITVEQQTVWDVSNDKKNYFWASMSECSFLIARTDDRVAAAHIGYGQVADLTAAVRYMSEAGFDMKSAVAIINSRPPEHHSGMSPSSPARHADAGDYETRGLQPENIHTYNYTGRDEEGMDRGLVQLVATPEDILLYSFDLHQVTGRSANKSPYYNNAVIEVPRS